MIFASTGVQSIITMRIENSNAKLAKHPAAPGTSSKARPKSPPPAYAEIGEDEAHAPLPSSIRGLHFEPQCQQQDRLTKAIKKVTPDECIAHLKLLASFADLRDTVSKTDGLFNINNKAARIYMSDEEKNRAYAFIREKRWAVYVQRAVQRFTTWFEKCIPTDGVGSKNGAVTMSDVQNNHNFSRCTEWETRIFWTMDMLPPLG